MKGCFTYIVECADGSFYTGWTNDLEKRIEAHNAGRGAKYTRSRGPVKLIWYREAASKEEAMQWEWRIKQMTHQEKVALIASL